MIAPVDSPVSTIPGFSSHRDALKKMPSVHGGTSLKLSEGSESPLLEAHPGSPVDLTGRRPSLATSLAASKRYHGGSPGCGVTELLLQREGIKEDLIIPDGVAAKGNCPVKDRLERIENECIKSPKLHRAPVQPFHIPAKVPEQEEVHSISLSVDDRTSMDTVLDVTSMDFKFEEENGLWISAIPIGHESRTSIATSTTAASRHVDDRFSHGALTVDTSVASSAASMFSSVGSIQSATTTSSDIYGWEEELGRKSSIEAPRQWNSRAPPRRLLPSGGRTMGPRLENNVPIYRRNDGKRKSLLHRVLNISGSRRETDDAGAVTPMVTSA
jgi:hypothetical protein